MGKVYAELAGLVAARANCIASGNTEWKLRHTEKAEKIVDEYLSSGSGIDGGVKIDFDKSTAERLVLLVPFHCMDQHGGYCGWRDYTIVVNPSLLFGFTLDVKGRDYNGLKDYLADGFNWALKQEVK